MARVLVQGVHTFWNWLRHVSGDAAYENYLRSQRRRAGGASCSHGSTGAAEEARTLSREEFYLDSLRRRYSGVSRCC